MTKKYKIIFFVLMSLAFVLILFFYRFTFVSTEMFDPVVNSDTPVYIFESAKQDQLAGLVIGSERSVFFKDYKNKNIEIIINIIDKKDGAEEEIRQKVNVYKLPNNGFKKIIFKDSVSGLRGKKIMVSYRLLFEAEINESIRIFPQVSDNTLNSINTTPKLLYKTNLIQLLCESWSSLERDPKFATMYYILILSIIISMLTILLISALNKNPTKR